MFFLRDVLVEVVTIVWHGFYTGRDSIILLCGKYRGRKIRKTLKGWILNFVWLFKKKKKVLVDATDAYCK